MSEQAALAMLHDHGQLVRLVTPCDVHGEHVDWVISPARPAGVADRLVQDLAARGLVAIDGAICRLSPAGRAARLNAPAPPPARPPLILS